MLPQAGSVVSKRRDGSSWWFWLKIFCHSKSILSRDDDTGPSHCRRRWDPGGPAPQWPGKKKNNLKLSALFYKISKNLTAFTVFRASNDTQQLSLAPGLHPAKSGRACYDNPTGKGVFLSDVQHVYLYSLFN